jgi:hypothetical protein
MTHTFSDIDDVCGTPHLAAVRRISPKTAFASMALQPFRDYPRAGISRPSIRGKTKEFCILRTSSFPFLLSVSAPRAAAARPSTAHEASR